MRKSSVKSKKTKPETQKAGEKPEVKTKYKPIIKYVKPVQEKPYTVRMWAGVKEVYACTKCDWQEDKKDDAVLHYLSHYPKNERSQILDRLVKEI